MKPIPMERDIMLAKNSKAGSRARSSPAKQSIRLSIEETGERGVQEHVSVQESGSYDDFNPLLFYDMCEKLYDFHQSKVPPELQMHEPQYPVSAKIADDVDPQESPSPGPEPEAGSSKTLSHVEEGKLGTVEDVPTGEIPIVPAGIINDQLTGVAVPCEMWSPDVPSGDLQEKKKKRKRRRKSVKKTVEQFLHKSSLELRSKLTRVLQLSPKMFSGLKTFGTTNLFEVVRCGFLNLFRSCALGRAERGAILILLFLIIFQSTSGLKTCEHMFNSPTPIDCPITLLNLKEQLQPTCNLKEIARCPRRTKCLNNISLCLRNYSIIFYFFEENTGTYSLEYGLKTDNQKIVHLVNKDCKEYPTTTAPPSRRDPQHMTTKTNPTAHTGNEASSASPAVIAGCVIAALAVLAAVGGIFFWWCHRRRQEKKKSMERGPNSTSLLDSATSSRTSVPDGI